MTKSAVITGGSKGLGRALAGELVGAGWRVVIDGRDGARLRQAASTPGPSRSSGTSPTPGTAVN